MSHFTHLNSSDIWAWSPDSCPELQWCHVTWGHEKIYPNKQVSIQIPFMFHSYSIHIPLYLVGGAITILKNMSSSMGRIIHDYPMYEMENKKCSKPPIRYHTISPWYSPVTFCAQTILSHGRIKPMEKLFTIPHNTRHQHPKHINKIIQNRLLGGRHTKCISVKMSIFHMMSCCIMLI